MIRRIFLALAAAACSFAAAQSLVGFLPHGTNSLAVTATAQNLTLPAVVVSSDPLNQVALTAVGTQPVYIRMDGTAATVANGMPVLANTQVLISVPSKTTAVSVISAATGTTLYATIGVRR